MSANVARLSTAREDLSEDDIRVATALIYTRFRGLFSGITQTHPDEGPLELVVWGPKTDAPLFHISRDDLQYVGVGEASGETISALRLEDLMKALRALYPPMSSI